MTIATQTTDFPALVSGHTLSSMQIRAESSEEIIFLLLPRQGKSASRFDHLNLAFYRRTMDRRDFQFFVNFIGADTFGFTQKDFDNLEDFDIAED
jgi:hypothetical protein